MKTLRDIEADVLRSAERIGASAGTLPTYGISHDAAWPHVEVRDGLYHYVVVERGQEISRRSSDRYDDLLYWIFRDVTHSLAFAYELQNRIEDQDCRRIAFPAQIRLMMQLSRKMCERLEIEIADILRDHPYDDEPTKAVNRMRQLDENRSGVSNPSPRSR